MKLYKVRVEFETVIRAESEDAARSDALYIIRHEDDGEADCVDVSKIETLSDLPSDWHGDCRPFGKRDPNDKTIAEILSSDNAEVSHGDSEKRS